MRSEDRVVKALHQRAAATGASISCDQLLGTDLFPITISSSERSRHEDPFRQLASKLVALQRWALETGHLLTYWIVSMIDDPYFYGREPFAYRLSTN